MRRAGEREEELEGQKERGKRHVCCELRGRHVSQLRCQQGGAGECQMVGVPDGGMRPRALREIHSMGHMRETMRTPHACLRNLREGQQYSVVCSSETTEVDRIQGLFGTTRAIQRMRITASKRISLPAHPLACLHQRLRCPPVRSQQHVRLKRLAVALRRGSLAAHIARHCARSACSLPCPIRKLAAFSPPGARTATAAAHALEKQTFA